ncbi:MAG: hypothetical protein HY923_06230 [Elusimicrobia bacterium]|nr:hypothetical protein [Elusimicrobiota bacterium]
MALPLAAVLAVVLALPASAEPKTYDAALAELSNAFSKGSDVAKISVAGQPAALIKLRDQAQYVQKGLEPGDQQETYITFIRSVARRLSVNSAQAVALYLKRPPRPARTAEAPPEEIAARTAIAEDVIKNPGISPAKKARLAQNLRRTSEYLKMGLNESGELISLNDAKAATPVVYVPPAAAAAVAYDPSARPQTDWSKLPPRVQPVSFITQPTPSPVDAGPAPSASASAMSWSSLSGLIDWEKGKQVAQEAFTGTLNYAKRMGRMCYMFVKQALIDAGVIDAPNPQSVGQIGLRPGAAKMFNQDVKKNPKILDEMGYRQVDLANASNDPATIPDGSMLVYGGGCAFADPTNGHAELTVSEQTYQELRVRNTRLRGVGADPNEVRVCHFSCTTRSMPFLRTYGKKGCLKMYVPVKSA